MSRILLSLLMLGAGVLHFVVPSIFDPAIPFEHKWPVNVFAGVLEIVLGLGLNLKKWQDQSAKILSLWFLCLVPIHIFVSWNHIAIFGIDNPFLLWARTVLQPVLYFWALSLQTKGWIMAQEWKDVLFIHYEVDPKILQEQVPFKLDLYNEKAIVSIVSFTMDKIRFPFLPVVPGLSKLNELNLRTYVEVDGIKGVYFFTLDTDLLAAIGIARIFFSLPYRFARISLLKKDQNYSFESHSKLTALKFSAEIEPIKLNSSFDIWATERYGLFTKKFNRTIHGIVQHGPWELQKVSLIDIKDHFSIQLGESAQAKDFLNPAYCKQLSVKFRPFYKLKKTT